MEPFNPMTFWFSVFNKELKLMQDQYEQWLGGLNVFLMDFWGDEYEGV